MEYKTIAKRSEDEFIIKRSKFIGHICPVKSRDEAVGFINEIKSKHWDATHNVYAYILRSDNYKKYSDDGEPQGTAGLPSLDVLEKEGLSDCCVVTTRYFGGIMLGAGGLVHAYSHTAKLAVDAGGIAVMRLCNIVKVSCDYSFYGRLPSLIAEYGGMLDNTDYSDNVTVTFKMPVIKQNAFDEKLIDLSFGKYGCEKIGEIYAETN